MGSPEPGDPRASMPGQPAAPPVGSTYSRHRRAILRFVSRRPQPVPNDLSRLWIVFQPPPPAAQLGSLFPQPQPAIIRFVSRRPQPTPNDLSLLWIVVQPLPPSALPCLLVHG